MTSNLNGRIKHYLADRDPVDALVFLLTRTMQFFRGIVKGYWLVFIGKGVTIRSRRNVTIGRFTRIEDFVELDGFGNIGIQIGDYCKVGKFSILRVPPVPYLRGAGIRIADQTTFAEYCFIGGAGLVDVGARNAFGQYNSIHPENHLPKGNDSTVETSNLGIRIGDDNWFGSKTTVLDGSSIGSRSIFAAGAVVRGSFPDDVMAAGVPARIKKTLNQ